MRAGLLFLAAALLQTVLWLAVLKVDPFGMSTAADRASEEIFLRFYPILYPGTSERIEIVLLNEQQIPLRSKSDHGDLGSKEWPLNYDEYVDLIQRVLAQNPRGVFIDILFDTGGEEAAPLRTFIEQLSPDGPPVVFADYAGGERAMLDSIRTLPFEGRGALRGVVELTASPNHYQLGLGNDGAASPAAVLFNATVPSEQRLELGQPSEFLLAWGNTVAAGEANDSSCAPITADDRDSRWRAFLDTALAGMQGMFGSSSALKGERSWERMQPCPYHPVIFARQLYRGDTAPTNARLRDAYVIIGADIAGSGDTVNSPVHGQLPGVFLHAMALDNLLSFRGPPFVDSVGPQIVQAIMILIVAFAGGLAFGGREAPRSRLGAAASLVQSAIAWAAYLLLIAGLLLLFVQEFKWAPYNWGGVAAIAFAIFFARAGTDFFVLLFGSERGS